MEHKTQSIKPIQLNSSDIKYKNALDSLIEQNSNLTFNNSGPSHASIVISSIFRHSREIVRIYANNMNGEISRIGDYLKELDNYLNSNKILKVILDRTPKNTSPAYDKIMNSISNNVEVRIASQAFSREVAFHYTPTTHFVTGDDKMLRLEYDNFNHQALCGFNNHRLTSPLINIFDRHFNGCNKIENKAED